MEFKIFGVEFNKMYFGEIRQWSVKSVFAFISDLVPTN
jgi:hypothetical protein